MRILGYRLSNDEAVTIADRDWGQHLYCIGASGAGKSTFLEGLNAQDLAEGRGLRLHRQHGDSAKRIPARRTRREKAVGCSAMIIGLGGQYLGRNPQ
jgi:ABC-type lipoprotein export system ATPase subunit